MFFFSSSSSSVHSSFISLYNEALFTNQLSPNIAYLYYFHFSSSCLFVCVCWLFSPFSLVHAYLVCIVSVLFLSTSHAFHWALTVYGINILMITCDPEEKYINELLLVL